MRTTVELSEDLFRKAKAFAALRGRKFKDIVEEGLRRVLENPDPAGLEPESKSPTLADLMRPSCGIIDSGVSDLGSNPRHLDGLGRDSMGNR